MVVSPQPPQIPNIGNQKGLMGAVRQWVYPAKVSGRFQKYHRALGIFQLLLFFSLPWLTIGEHPAFQIDIGARRVHLLGTMFTATDTILVVLTLMFLAFSLFFFTALFGRLWCGYACPQTVFLEELIRPIESFIEGDRPTRMMRDAKGRWTPDWIKRKFSKWAAFAVISVATGMTFVSYFAGASALWAGQSSVGAYGATAFFSGLMFFDFAYFREQFCNYLCPYARFQGALTDEQSLTVAYDFNRGEPRGTARMKKEESQKNGFAGACIDCKKCVTVCPQGIDIRNGFQLECINCARCVDACTGVLGKLGQPSLVTYTTIATQKGTPTRLLRPRTLLYAGMLTTILVAFGVVLSTHHLIYANITRASGSLYNVDNDGWIRNTYLLRVTNNHPGPKDEEARVTVQVEGLPANADIRVTEAILHPEQTATIPVIVRVPPDSQLPRAVPLHIVVTAPWDQIGLETTFSGPGEETK